MTSQVLCEIDDGIAHVTFDHVAARNAMTVGMYQSLKKICQDLAQNPQVRLVIFRGAGGKSFVAGVILPNFLTLKRALMAYATKKELMTT